MGPEQNLESIRIVANDPKRVVLLKSRYNRYASRLNYARSSFWKKEHTVLLKELALLKIEIENYQ
jgi:hypothetical protein